MRQPVVIGANDMLIGGVQRLIIDQLTHLDRTKYEPHLVVLMTFPGKETFDGLIPADVTVHRIGFSGLADMRAWFRLLRLLRRIRPKIVKTATFFSNFIFLKLKPLVGYAVIAAEHNTVNVKPGWQRFADRMLFPRAYTVVGDSEMVVEFVSRVERIDRSKFTVIYNGVDTKAVAEAKARYAPERTAIRKQWNIPENAYVLFTAARLTHQKNHALMLDAFKRIADEQPDAYLVIAGDGALRKEIEAQIRELRLAGRVVLLGEQLDVFRYYAIADLFVLTSRHEGFCIAVMEALAFGMPAVSTRVAGVNEYLQDGKNGFFAEATPEDFAEKIRTAMSLTAAEREAFAEEGRKTAEAYSVERYGREYNELFARCLASAK